MECRDVRDRLAELFEGTVSGEERRGLWAHLSACPACREAYEDLRRTVALVGGLDELEPPPYLAQRIMAHVQEEAEERARGGLLRRIFLPLHVKLPIEALAIFLIAAFAFQVYRTVESDTRLAGKLEESPKSAVETTPKPEAIPPKLESQDRSGEEALRAKKEPPSPSRATAPGASATGGLRPDTAQPPPQMEKAPRDETPVTPSAPAPAPRAAGPEPGRGSYDAGIPAEPRPRGGAGAPSAPPALSAPPSRYSATPVPPPPAAAQKAREYKAPAAASVPMPAEQKTDSAERQLGSAVGLPSGSLFVALRAQDVNLALDETEKLLAGLGARNIRKVCGDRTALVTAVLGFGRAQELSDRLSGLGQTTTRLTRPDSPEGDVLVRIEITRAGEQ